MDKKKSKHRTLVAFLIAAVFVLLQVPALVNHEISTAEAATWLQAVGKAEVYPYAVDHVEPSTFLWQFILTPFARMGLPVIFGNILALLLVGLAVFVLVRNVKAHWLVKLAAMFSIVFLYWAPVVASTYALIPLAVVLLAALYPKRMENPVGYGLAILFLSQTHFLMLPLAVVLVVEYMFKLLGMRKEKKFSLKKNVVGFLIPVFAAVAFAVVGLIQVLGISVVETNPENFPYIMEFFAKNMNIAVCGIEFPLLLVALVPFAIYMVFKHFKSFVMFAISFVAAVLMVMFVYNGFSAFAMRGLALGGIVLFFALLISQDFVGNKNKIVGLVGAVICALPFVVTVPATVSAYMQDLNENYSVSRDASKFVDELKGDTRTIFMVADMESQEILLPVIAERPDSFYAIIGGNGDDIYRISHSVDTLYSQNGYSVVVPEKIESNLEKLMSNYDNVYLVMHATYSCGSEASEDYVDVLSKSVDEAVLSVEDYTFYNNSVKQPIDVIFHKMK